MKSFFASLAVVAALATTALSQFTINTPLSVVVCLPTRLDWVGGTGPYFLSILPANQPSAPALVDLGQQSGNSVTWLTNLGVGTSAFLNLRDSTGTLAQSGPFTVQSGSNTTCVGQSLSASSGPGATAAPGSAPAPASGSPSPSPSVTSGGSVSTTPHNTASGTGTGSSAPKPTSGALSKFAGAGAAAFVGSAILSIVV